MRNPEVVVPFQLVSENQFQATGGSVTWLSSTLMATLKHIKNLACSTNDRA